MAVLAPGQQRATGWGSGPWWQDVERVDRPPAGGANLEVEVGTGAAACAAHLADRLALLHEFGLDDLAQSRFPGLPAAAVVVTP